MNASGRPVAKVAVGQQMDCVALDARHALLRGLPTPQATLSSHVFASHRRSAIHGVWAGGRLLVHDGAHRLADETRNAFNAARSELLSTIE
jgi:formimidoylglutamate deiminase